MKKTLYYSYGSNMNKHQMRFRCPDAEPVGQLSIKGWKLVFRGVADIIQTKNENDIVRGAVWRITDSCEDSLDTYEGYIGPGRGLYTKILFNTKKFGTEEIMAYIMNPIMEAPIECPSKEYFYTIRDGYKDFGYDPTSLDEVLKEYGGFKPRQDQKQRYSFVGPIDEERKYDPWDDYRELDRSYQDWWEARYNGEAVPYSNQKEFGNAL